MLALACIPRAAFPSKSFVLFSLLKGRARRPAGRSSWLANLARRVVAYRVCTIIYRLTMSVLFYTQLILPSTLWFVKWWICTTSSPNHSHICQAKYKSYFVFFCKWYNWLCDYIAPLTLTFIGSPKKIFKVESISITKMAYFKHKEFLPIL